MRVCVFVCVEVAGMKSGTADKTRWEIKGREGRNVRGRGKVIQGYEEMTE